MLKFLLIAIVLGYIFRRVLFTPLNQGTREAPRQEKPKGSGYTNKAGEYTDYEEIK